MKTFVLLFLGISISHFTTNAQNVKDQSHLLNSIQIGNYTPYLAKWDGKRNYGGGIDDRTYEVTSIETYKVLPGLPHKEVYIVLKGNKTDASKHKPSMFIPDNVAFPVTYMMRVYEGNRKIQENVGYCPRTDVYEDTRAVFLDGKIYILENWKDKDHYNLKAVLEYREKKLKGLKMMKEVMKSPKKMKSEKPHEKLQNYLDKATAKQNSFYSTWSKQPENVKTIQYLKDLETATEKAIKNYNDAIFNSPEHQRMLAHRRWMDKNVNMTVTNNTGRTIWIGSNDKAFITTKLNAGESRNNVTCTNDMYYYYSNARNSNGTKFYSAKGACGSVVTINL